LASSFGGFLGGDTPFVGNASPAGWSGIAAAGYNMTFGPALVGIELDGRWGNEKFEGNAISANNSGVSPAGAILYRYDFTNDAGVHLSGRLGAVLGDTLIFAKLGAGASRIRDSFAVDQRAAFRCSSTTFVAGTVNPVTLAISPSFTVCNNPVTGGAGSFI